MASLSNLLSLLQNDGMKYYVLRGRDLYTEDNFSILQNDNNSTKIRILLPLELGGFSINDKYNFYIDYIDGAGKPGVVSNETNVINLYKQTSDGNTYVKMDDGYSYSKGVITITSSSTTVSLKDIENNQFKDANGNLYVVETNTQYSIDGKTYTSKIKNENFEDSAEISLDFDNPYSNAIYFIKSSPNLEVGNTSSEEDSEGRVVNYLYFDWILDKQVTNAVGTVNFSIRIEKEDTGFNWQSNTISFPVVSNLKETYYLKKEIEENYIIQNRTIKPVGNFENILVKGDTNSNKLFYKMNRYFQGQDMLAKKTFIYDNKEFDVYKNQNNVFAFKNGDYYTWLNIEYSINDLQIWRHGKTGTYDPITNSFYIDGISYYIKSLVKNPANTSAAAVQKYQYTLTYTINNSDTVLTTNFENLNGIFTLLNTNKEEVEYGYNIAAVGENFTRTNSTTNDMTHNIWVPVFNRLIRFVFMSPNKDYGDWNNGEIEYINTDEDYFIFSWTPDSRATRSEGELSYYIEFFINGNYEELLDETGITSVRTRSYSWSTLPTTISVESNEAATATVNYIPHWVNYIENELQADMEALLNNDLQSQYNALEEYFINAILGDYSYPIRFNFEEDKTVRLDDVEYNILRNDDIITISNAATATLLNIALLPLSTDNIYGAAAQIGQNSIQITKVEVVTENESQTIYEDVTNTLIADEENVTITYNNTNYSTTFPHLENETLTFADENGNEITCRMTYNTALINNYFIVYNDTLNRLTFYELANENNITVPFLQLAQEKLQSWINEGQAQLNSQETNYNTFLTNMIAAFGIDGQDNSNNITSLYQRIMGMFMSIGNELQLLYNGNGGSSLTIVDSKNNNSYTVYNNGDYNVVDINGVRYYVQSISYRNNKGIIETKVEIETDPNNFYVPGKYYTKIEDNYKLSYDLYNIMENYYKQNGKEFKRVTFNLINLNTDGNIQVTNVFGLSIYATLTTLYQTIQAELQSAKDQAQDSFDTQAAALTEQYNDYSDSLLNEMKNNEAILETNYQAALTDFYNTWSAEVNSDLLNQIADLKASLDEAINKTTEKIVINAQANTLIITPNEGLS